MYKLILFDLDGTLTDPKIGICKSVQYALESIGRPERDIEKLTPFIGPPLLDMFMSYCKVDKDVAQALVAKYRERFSTVGLFENEIYDGIAEMLSELKNAGFKIALATSKPTVFADKILEYFDIKKYFDIVVGSELNGQRTKKSDVINEVISQASMQDCVSDIIMVGDRMYDVEGAKAFGMASTGVTYGYGGYDELKAAGADYIADTVEELKNYILNH